MDLGHPVSQNLEFKIKQKNILHDYYTIHVHILQGQKLKGGSHFVCTTGCLQVYILSLKSLRLLGDQLDQVGLVFLEDQEDLENLL